MTAIFQENITAYWKGADITIHQRAQLAVQNLQKKYCTEETPTTFSLTEPSASTSQPTKKEPKKPSETTSTPLTFLKTPHKSEPQNPHCEVLCLPGTTENNLKAAKLHLFIESEFNLYMNKSKFLN